MIKVIGSGRMRKQFSAVMDEVTSGNDYILTRSGIPIVAFISVERYKNYKAALEDYQGTEYTQKRVKW